jgi:lipoprotein-anchoring transpeptidase ErfK/SrfK
VSFIFVLLRGAICLGIALIVSDASRAGAGEMVAFSGYAPGTIVVKTEERRLYYIVDAQQALRFPVGVGRPGMTWNGTARIEGKYVRPAWAAPGKTNAKVIPGGSPNNPMGAAALTMRGGTYAIHGTNRPDSIGGFVSLGCIRMHNNDIQELYRLVSIGTRVVVEQ